MFFFGLILPLFFEAILRHLVSQNNIYDNSMLVFNNINRKFQFLYKYIIAYRVFFEI